MAQTEDLKITAFNCQGFKPRNYDFVKHMFVMSSILLIQEHWLYDFEFNIFAQVLPDSSYYAVSSMDSKVLRRGRPFGGTAIIWKNNINAKITPISTSTPRLCAVLLESFMFNIVLISVYMPVDEEENNNDFLDILNEINSFYHQYEDYEVVIGGDFNSDLIRNNARSMALVEWHRALGVVCPALQPNAPRRPTHYTYDGTPTVLDYIFMNEGLHDALTSWNVVDSGDNLSDHNPVTVQLDRNANYISRRSCKIDKPIWINANNDQIALYKGRLDQLLENIDIPVGAAACTNGINCNAHKEDFIKFLNEIIVACQVATKESIPHNCNNSRSKKIPGWNDHVRDARVTSMWWHERWKEAGRPRTGWVAEIRRRTRMKYHLAIKECIRDKDKFIKTKISKSLENKNKKEFWSNISKLNKRKIDACSVIDGKAGDDACNAFRDKYFNLYNANPSDSLEQIKEQINNRIQANCMNAEVNNNCCNHHLHSVTQDIVKGAIKKLKRSQYDQQTKLMSDSFINGTYKLQVMIGILFTIMIKHGFQCESINITTLVPIPKDKKKSLSDSDNYRAIAPNNIFIKLLDYVILEKFSYVFTTSDNQFAYKQEFSTTLCSFLAIETIQYYLDAGSTVYATYLDCSKAFDYIKYDRLFHSLINRNMCPLVIRLILNLYINAKYCVNWNHKQSDTFTVQNGVKQGGVISPLLFAIFVEELIERVKNSKLGCYVGDKCASILVFADDVLLLSPTRFSTQNLLNICKNFADEVGLKFNIGKCKYIVFGSSYHENIQIFLGNAALGRVNQEKHIGNKLSNIGDIVNFEDIITGIAVKTNCLKRIFNCVDSQSKCTLFNAQCCSMYGIELIDITSPQFEKLQIQWRKSIRYLINLHPRTHNELLPHIVGTPNVQSLVYSRILCFFR